MDLILKYRLHREVDLSGLWIRYKDIAPLIDQLPKEVYQCNVLGYSEKQVPIHKITVGHGTTKVLLWSQMHGDESTATKGIFDILNFISSEYQTNAAIKNLLKSCTLVFVPMLNPDGAELYIRENANGIDLNRDAQALESKEAQLLKHLVSAEKPNYAFNLHDQTSWYNVAMTDKVASLSFLSPAADVDKTLTNARVAAMRVIVAMHRSLQKHLPDQIGRYNDTYCESCFGDSIQKMGFPTILVESGYYPDDEMREETRKFHFIALMSALFDIANESLPEHDAYEDIPMNEKYYYDTRLNNVLYKGKQTAVAVRFICKIVNSELVKLLDPTETIVGEELENKFFHKTIDAKGKDFTDFFSK